MFATLPNFNQMDAEGFRVSAVGSASGYSVGSASAYAASSPGASSGIYAGSGGITAPLPTPAAHAARDLPEIETLNVELSKDNQGMENMLIIKV